MKKLIIFVLMFCFVGCQPAFGVVEDVAVPERFTPNGSLTTFNFTFRLVNQSDLVATLRTDATGADVDLTLNVDYTLSATNNDFGSGGTVTFSSAPASGTTLVLERDMSRTQGVNLRQGQALPAESTETTLDKMMMSIQDIDKDLSFIPGFPHGDPVTSLGYWPNSIDRAGKAAAFDETTGAPTAIAMLPESSAAVSAFAEKYLDDPTAPLTQNTLGGIFTYNVKDPVYGAAGDGATNDTTSVQAAFDAAITAGGGIVFFPFGTYSLSNISVPAIENIVIMGAGAHSILDFNLVSSGTAFAIGSTSTRARDIMIKDLGIEDSRDTSLADDLLVIAGGTGTDSSARITMINVEMDEYNNSSGSGIKLDNLSHVTMIAVRQSHEFGAEFGLEITNSNVITTGVFTFSDCYFSGEVTGLKILSDAAVIDSINFIGCWIGAWSNANANESIELDATSSSIRNLNFTGCHIENADPEEVAIITVTGAVRCLKMTGCHIAGVSGEKPQYGIQFSAATLTSGTFSNNTFQNIANESVTSGATIRFENDCTLSNTNPVIIGPTDRRITSPAYLDIETGGNEDTIINAIINHFDTANGKTIPTLDNNATPTVLGFDRALSGGTTTITDFDDGVEGQSFKLISEHALTITDGTNIFLEGSINWIMAATDTLSLIQKADGKWYETGRSFNASSPVASILCYEGDVLTYENEIVTY